MKYSILVLSLISMSPSDSFDTPLLRSLVYPTQIEAVIGEEIYVRLIGTIRDQIRCTYRLTGGKDIDIRRPHKSNYVSDSMQTCGLIINDVTIQDAGFLRLTSQNSKNELARGIVFINVTKLDKVKTNMKVEKMDVDVTPENTNYCYVLRAGDTSTKLPEHDNCNFPDFQKEFEGNGDWTIVAGVKGRIQEVSFPLNVQIPVEHFQTFVEHKRNPETLNMKCKLFNSKKMIKFCRFLRLSDDKGFNLEDGLGNGRYSYYGNGFKFHECGISIAHPSAVDKSPWKCFVGVDEHGEVNTVGAIVDGSSPHSNGGDIDADDVYGQENTAVNILCKRNVPTDYCWFRAPSGEYISVSDTKASEPTHTYRYYGSGIKFGECGVTISSATHQHTGLWSCNMGQTNVSGTDASERVSVRIVDSVFVSTTMIRDVRVDSSELFECRSISFVPVEYCRFVLPNGTGFNLNENTTSDNAFMGNYFLNPNKKMAGGYCSMIIKSIDRNIHQGKWLCAARLVGRDQENIDEFTVAIYEEKDVNTNVGAAGITGMVLGLTFVAGAIIFVTYRKYYQSYSLRQQPRNTIISYISGTETVSISSDDSPNRENIELRVLNTT